VEEMSDAVVDSCVWIDMISKDRPRHGAAIDLARKFERDKVTVLVPMHAFFEILTAVSSEARKRGGSVKVGELGETFPFPQHYIPIDNDFLRQYVFDPLPPPEVLNVDAGDMIFLAVARKRQCPLITEDQKFVKRAVAVGVRALGVAEYLQL
jgi:predicted nucleic acid-binding protein